MLDTNPHVGDGVTYPAEVAIAWKQQRDAAEKLNADMHENFARMMRERDAARTQLAERDSLLRECRQAMSGMPKAGFVCILEGDAADLLQRIEAALDC